MGIEIKKCPKCGREISPKIDFSSGSPVTSLLCLCCISGKIEIETEKDLKLQDLQIFVRCLSIAYKQFCLNEKMHKAIKTGLYDKFNQQWNAILIALETDYKLWLGKILERKYTHKFLGRREFSEELGETEKKIMEWRNGFLAHFNFKNLREYESFVEKNPLESNLIRNLFYKIAEVINQYDSSILNLKESFQQIEKETEAECDKWLDNFKKLD